MVDIVVHLFVLSLSQEVVSVHCWLFIFWTDNLTKYQVVRGEVMTEFGLGFGVTRLGTRSSPSVTRGFSFQHFRRLGKRPREAILPFCCKTSLARESTVNKEEIFFFFAFFFYIDNIFIPEDEKNLNENRISFVKVSRMSRSLMCSLILCCHPVFTRESSQTFN